MEQRLGRGFQFGIPLLSEAPDKWVFEEPVDRQLQLIAQCHGILAHGHSL